MARPLKGHAKHPPGFSADGQVQKSRSIQQLQGRGLKRERGEGCGEELKGTRVLWSMTGWQNREDSKFRQGVIGFEQGVEDIPLRFAARESVMLKKKV